MQNKALEYVLNERKRQDEKWGIQNHSMEWWLAILGEEYGELAKAILDVRFENGDPAHVRTECVQVCAVALSIIECIDRNKYDQIKRKVCSIGLEHWGNCPGSQMGKNGCLVLLKRE